ncbi:DNA-binding protein [Mycobacteroides abscessus]|uniref:DNA-binding protein n=1 Tax=Mycobacteroides abscessus TaxID=36809 RepID=UPI000C2673F1|nr:DNA-binding protein [Mycobacteroides abscessus]
MGELSSIVQSYMDASGASEAAVARLIGANPQTVNAWRNAGMKQLPRQDYLRRLAELTKVEYNTVLTAALIDTGYLNAPMSTQAEIADSLILLAINADKADSSAKMVDTRIDFRNAADAVYLTESVEDLLSEVELLTGEIHDLALSAVGGDIVQLRQAKRNIRRQWRPGLFRTGPHPASAAADQDAGPADPLGRKLAGRNEGGNRSQD